MNKKWYWLRWCPSIALPALLIPGVREWAIGEWNHFTAWFLTWHYYVQGAATGTAITLTGTLLVARHAWLRQQEQMKWDSRERRIQRNSDAREARRERNHAASLAETERKHSIEKECYFAFLETLSTLTTTPEDYVNHLKEIDHTAIIGAYNSTAAKVRVIASEQLYPKITDFDCSYAAHTSNLSILRSNILDLHGKYKAAKDTTEKYRSGLENNRKITYEKVDPVNDTTSYLQAIKQLSEAQQNLENLIVTDAEAYNKLLEASISMRDDCFKAYESLLRLQVAIEMEIKNVIGTPIDTGIAELSISRSLSQMKTLLAEKSKTFLSRYTAQIPQRNR